MQEFISLCFGVLVGGFIGFNVGVERITGKVQVAAQRYIDAVRKRFGSPIEWNFEVGKDASGNPVMQTIELLELPEDLENLGAELFKLK